MMRIFAIAVLLILASCSEDPNEAANKLFVQAQAKITQADTLPPEQGVESLRAALAELNSIVEKYPSSDLAVKISSGQNVGTISIAALKNKIPTYELRALEKTIEPFKNKKDLKKAEVLRIFENVFSKLTLISESFPDHPISKEFTSRKGVLQRTSKDFQGFSVHNKDKIIKMIKIKYPN